jgi:hypothetical protein
MKPVPITPKLGIIQLVFPLKSVSLSTLFGADFQRSVTGLRPRQGSIGML